MIRSEFLHSFPAFRNSAKQTIDDLIAAAAVSTIPAGTQIYREGDACNGIALVLSGDIRVFKIGPTGREITLYEIGPGETCILNASCILSGKTYPAHAVALSDVQVLLVPAAVFARLVNTDDAMRHFVFMLLSQRLAGVMELVEEVAFGRMDERLAEYLVERSSDDLVETTHQRIANDLGTSREVVSRLLKELERRGVVRLSRTAITLIKDPARPV